MMDTSTDTKIYELNNIQYNSRKGSVISSSAKSAITIDALDKLLETDKNNNKHVTWTKLNDTIRYKKILDYVSTYSKKHSLNYDETSVLNAFLYDSISRKKLQRVKDVEYDVDAGKIKNIPGLVYNKTNKKYTLKNMNKRVCTLKHLPITLSKNTS